ncbi:helix-turn-helix domain-containing protein [Streptomyces sp. NPDC005474]|uniref:helix-turn-helix domain-containing protein n=1 Tax=Streptomyces sp. NPDC005474 TaxID=3154878 RepID=UPI003452347C
MAALDRVGQARLTSLSTMSGLPKTTVRRLLQQLAQLGAVERRDGTYRMGPRLFRFGQGWEPYPGLRAASREPVRRLVTATGATVGISVLSEGRTLVLEWTAGRDTALAPLLDVVSWPWFTAAGKAQAAAVTPRVSGTSIPSHRLGVGQRPARRHRPDDHRHPPQVPEPEEQHTTPASPDTPGPTVMLSTGLTGQRHRQSRGPPTSITPNTIEQTPETTKIPSDHHDRRDLVNRP